MYLCICPTNIFFAKIFGGIFFAKIFLHPVSPPKDPLEFTKNGVTCNSGVPDHKGRRYAGIGEVFCKKNIFL